MENDMTVADAETFRISHENDLYSAQVTERELTKKEAIKIGIKAGLLAFFIAVLSIIIPIAHFLTVPLGILASPFIGFFIYKMRVGDIVLQGDFVCPSCSRQTNFKNISKSDDMSLTCEHCRVQVKLMAV